MATQIKFEGFESVSAVAAASYSFDHGTCALLFDDLSVRANAQSLGGTVRRVISCRLKLSPQSGLKSFGMRIRGAAARGDGQAHLALLLPTRTVVWPRELRGTVYARTLRLRTRRSDFEFGFLLSVRADSATDAVLQVDSIDLERRG